MSVGDWQPGDEVQCLYLADGKWYSATIQRVNHDGTYKVHWDEFQCFSRVTDENIKEREKNQGAVESGILDPTMTYSHSLKAVKMLEMQQAISDAKKRGEKVDLSILEPAAKKRKLNDGATARAEIYSHFWEDEDFENIQFFNEEFSRSKRSDHDPDNVPAEERTNHPDYLEKYGPAGKGLLATTFEDVNVIDTPVHACWPDDGYWYPGRVLDVHPEKGMLTIEYYGFDDMDNRKVHPSHVRRNDSLYPPGIPVQGRWVNGAFYDGGVIHGKNEDQTYEIYWPQFHSCSHNVPIQDLMESQYPATYALIYPGSLNFGTKYYGNTSYCWEPCEKWFTSSRKYKRYPKSSPGPQDAPSNICGLSYVAPTEESGIQHPVYRMASADSNTIPLPTRVKATQTLESLKKTIMLMTRTKYEKETAGPRLAAIHKLRKQYLFNPSTREPILNEHNAQEFTGPGFMGVMEQLDSEIFLCLHLLWTGEAVVAPPGAMGDRANILKKSNVQLCLLATKENKSMAERTFVSTKPLMAVRLEFFMQHTSFVKLKVADRQYLQALCEITAAYFEKTVLPKYNKSAAALRTAELTADRDTYSHLMHPLSKTVQKGKHAFVKTDIAFNAKKIPVCYKRWIAEQNKFRAAEQLPALPMTGQCGASLFTGIFSAQELDWVEAKIEGLGKMKTDCKLKPMTTHTVVRGGEMRRMRMFFGARPLWTESQQSKSDSNIAAGVRMDVDGVPAWVTRRIVGRLVSCGILPANYVNVIQIDVADGTTGTESRLACSSRIKRPWVAVQLSAPSRYTFGTQKRHQENALSFVPLPRGGVLQFKEGGFFSDGVEHCMRPYDMHKKSVTLLLFHYHEECLLEAREHLAWCRQEGIPTEGDLKVPEKSELPEGQQW